MNNQFNANKILSGILLIIGTATGAGMLALPLSTGEAGFIPSFCSFIACSFFMGISAIYLLEVNLIFPSGTNLITMAESTLGKKAKILTGIIYLILLLALLSLYLKASTGWFNEFLIEKFSFTFSPSHLMLIISCIGAGIIFLGLNVVDKINRLLSFGLFLSYLLLIITAAPHIKPKHLTTFNTSALPKAFPLILTTFGFGIIVPSLTTFYNKNVRVLKQVIILGSIITLGIYLAWEFVSLGVLPLEGPHGIKTLLGSNDNGLEITNSLQTLIGLPLFSQSANYFALFALLSSYLGVGLSLFHFIKDALKIKTTPIHTFTLSLLTFFPPFMLMYFNATGFHQILSFAGIFVALLLGILPSLMVWKIRHHSATSFYPQVFGGKIMLCINMLFFIYIIIQELLNVFLK
ncbi:MAG: tyrP [Francisellaceae bacterium]|nr:tyrP [Francisellaceae bacterium]